MKRDGAIRLRTIGEQLARAALLLLFLAALWPAAEARAAGRLAEFLDKVTATAIDPAADRFGSVDGNPPAAPLLKGDKLVGYAFLNGDIVDSTGYSGKPVNIVV